jgi:hypothetical protein
MKALVEALALPVPPKSGTVIVSTHSAEGYTPLDSASHTPLV